MLTREWYLSQHAADAKPGELTAEIESNATVTVDRANALLVVAGMEYDGLRSGWRPAATNSTIPNAAPKSKHMTGQAVDIADKDGKLDAWCMEHRPELVKIGLWMEHPDATPGWCHVQTLPPKSGDRVYCP